MTICAPRSWANSTILRLGFPSKISASASTPRGGCDAAGTVERSPRARHRAGQLPLVVRRAEVAPRSTADVGEHERSVELRRQRDRLLDRGQARGRAVDGRDE